MHEWRKPKLAEFVNWAQQHITGDEKGQAQIFLDRLFQAFGQKGSLDVGGSPEFRVRKSTEDGGGVSFADYVWKPVVLVEMKKRGVDLSKHRAQMFDYWTRIAPGRPAYAVLCNFDQFAIYDFNTQLDTPKDIVQLEELPDRYSPLAFLFPSNEKPVFGNDREAVTRKAADKLAECFNKLIVRKVDRHLAQRFILQTLVTLFAEDINLLDANTFSKLLEDCKEPSDSYDLLGGLFEAMNTPGGIKGGRFKGVDYFNGGIFREPARIELYQDEINQLKGAAKENWSKVSPEIFGALFQDSMGKEERHAFGAHYTSPVDIMKIVKPTIADPWTEAIESAKTAKHLSELAGRLSTLRVLDPACGSGNFLYLAYREMKRLEERIRERLATDFPGSQAPLTSVTTRQFFGLDINEFAVELAKVTLMIGHKLAIDELHIIQEAALPLDNLDENFLAVDALISPLTSSPGNSPLPAPGTPGEGKGGSHEGKSWISTEWPPADVIIGNPPFLGAKRLKPERGADYVNRVRKAYPDVPGMADYCVYWFRKAHDHLPRCTAKDEFAGRAGLVGTQNIRNNQSRVGGLDYIVKTGTLVEAVENQPWSGEANVHVSIANWVKTQDPVLLPETRSLWSQTKVRHTLRKIRAQGNAAKIYDLSRRNVVHINSALSDEVNVASAIVLEANTRPQRCFQGVVPGYEGFVVSSETAAQLREGTINAHHAIKPFLIGRDLLTGDGTPSRYIIDFDSWDQVRARRYIAAFCHIEQNVLPAVQEKVEKASKTDMAVARREHLNRWWQFWNVRQGLRSAIFKVPRYIVCSRVTKRPIFAFVDRSIVPDTALQAFVFADDYSFGCLQSSAHWVWFVANCSKLKSDFRYTGTSVFDTFPWPQAPSPAQVRAVAAAAQNVRSARTVTMDTTPGGLRAIYRTLELPGKHPLKDTHAALDAAVLAAYGFSPKKDLLAQLLDLNRAVASRIEAGMSVVAPGVPRIYGDPAPLITDDCIKP